MSVYIQKLQNGAVVQQPTTQPQQTTQSESITPVVKKIKNNGEDIDINAFNNALGSNIQPLLERYQNEWGEKKTQAFLDQLNKFRKNLSDGNITSFDGANFNINNVNNSGLDLTKGGVGELVGWYAAKVLSVVPKYTEPAKAKKTFTTSSLNQDFSNQFFAGNSVIPRSWYDLDVIGKGPKGEQLRATNKRAATLAQYLDNYDLSKYTDTDDTLGGINSVKQKIDRLRTALHDGTLNNEDYAAADALNFNLRKYLSTDANINYDTNGFQTDSATPAASGSSATPTATAAATETAKRDPFLEAIQGPPADIQEKQARDQFSKWSKLGIRELANQYSMHYTGKTKSGTGTYSGTNTLISNMAKQGLSKQAMHSKIQQNISNIGQSLKKNGIAYYWTNRTGNFGYGIKNSDDYHRNFLDLMVAGKYSNSGTMIGNQRAYTIPDSFDEKTGTVYAYVPQTRSVVRLNVWSHSDLYKSYLQTKYPGLFQQPTQDAQAAQAAAAQAAQQGSDSTGEVPTAQYGMKFDAAPSDNSTIDAIYDKYRPKTKEELAQIAQARQDQQQKLLQEQEQKSLDRKTGSIWKNPADRAELYSILLDLGSMGAAYLGPAGTAASIVTGLGGTAEHAYALSQDADGMSAKDWGETAANAGLDIVGAVPFIGNAAKLSKISKTVIKWAPRLLTAFSLYKSAGPAAASVKKLVSSGDANDMTVQDWRNIANGVMSIMGGANLGTAELKNKAMTSKVGITKAPTEGEHFVNVTVKQNDQLIPKRLKVSTEDAAKINGKFTSLADAKKAVIELPSVKSQLTPEELTDLEVKLPSASNPLSWLRNKRQMGKEEGKKDISILESEKGQEGSISVPEGKTQALPHSKNVGSDDWMFTQLNRFGNWAGGIKDRVSGPAAIFNKRYGVTPKEEPVIPTAQPTTAQPAAAQSTTAQPTSTQPTTTTQATAAEPVVTAPKAVTPEPTTLEPGKSYLKNNVPEEFTTKIKSVIDKKLNEGYAKNKNYFSSDEGKNLTDLRYLLNKGKRTDEENATIENYISTYKLDKEIQKLGSTLNSAKTAAKEAQQATKQKKWTEGTLNFQLRGGRLQKVLAMHRNGGQLIKAQSGVKFTNGTGDQWRQQVFDQYKNKILENLAKYEDNYANWLNTMQHNHSLLYNAANDSGNWQERAYDNPMVRDYQVQYDKRTDADEINGFNQTGILNAENNNRYNISGKRRTSGDWGANGNQFKADGYYSAITDDRRLLGRKGTDWDENSQEFKDFKSQLANKGYDFYLDPSDNYYKLRKLGTQQQTINGTASGQLGTAAPKEKQDIAGQILKGMTNPNLIGLGRMVGDIAGTNARFKEYAQHLNPVMVQPYQIHRAVTGDYGTENWYANQGNKYLAQARKNVSSDANVNNAMQLDALGRADQLYQKGLLADNEMIAKTKAASQQAAEFNAANNNEVANKNLVNMNSNERELAGLKAATGKANQDSIDYYLMGLEKDLKEKQNLKDLEQKQMDIMALGPSTPDLTGDSTLLKLQSDYDKETDPTKKLEIAKQAATYHAYVEKLYRDQYIQKLAQLRGLNYKQAEWQPAGYTGQNIFSAKKGTDTGIFLSEAAKVKSKNDDRLLKTIMFLINDGSKTYRGMKQPKFEVPNLKQKK